MNQTTRYHATNNYDLVKHLKDKGVIKSQRVFETMCLVDRKKYVNNFNPYNEAYIDAPQSIGHGRTISAPHMHAAVLENLEDKLLPGKRVLAIRCSAGYLTTCMALMIRSEGFIVNIESIPELHEEIRKNIENDFSNLLENQIYLFLGNEGLGYPLTSPYDVIYVGAASENIPQTFIDQLAVGGRLIMPIGSKDGAQELIKIDKYVGGNLIKTSLLSVRYGYLNISEPITYNKPIDCISGNRSLFKTPPQSTLLSKASSSENINSNIVNNKMKKEAQENMNSNIVNNEMKKKAQENMNSNIVNNEMKKEAQENVNSSIIKNETKFIHVKKNGRFLLKSINLNNKIQTETIEKANKITQTEIKTVTIIQSDAKYCSIESRMADLEREMKILKESSEQEREKQEIFINKIANELKSIIEKWKDKSENKLELIKNDIIILDRKISEKISKVEGTIKEKINDKIGEWNSEEIRMSEIRFDKKATEERAAICKHLDEELKNKIKLLEEKLKEKNIKRFTVFNKISTKLCNTSIFGIIIVLHATLVISKKFVY